MDVLEAIITRRSVRDYLPVAPSRETLLTLIEAATRAPNAVNRQPWSFTVLRDRAVLDQISRDAKAYMTRTRPLALPEQLYEKLADPEFHVFYRAPVLIVIAATAGAPWIAEDCALAAENLMLAAHGSGLASCWIGLAQPWLATQEGRRAIGLAEGQLPLAPIIIGHPRTPAPESPRQPPEIHWVD